MRYTNIILTCIAVVLGVIALRLWELGIMVKQLSEGGRYMVNAYQAVIGSNQQLGGDIAALKKQIQETGDKIVKR